MQRVSLIADQAGKANTPLGLYAYAHKNILYKIVQRIVLEDHAGHDTISGQLESENLMFGLYADVMSMFLTALPPGHDHNALSMWKGEHLARLGESVSHQGIAVEGGNKLWKSVMAILESLAILLGYLKERQDDKRSGESMKNASFYRYSDTYLTKNVNEEWVWNRSIEHVFTDNPLRLLIAFKLLYPDLKMETYHKPEGLEGMFMQGIRDMIEAKALMHASAHDSLSHTEHQIKEIFVKQPNFSFTMLEEPVVYRDPNILDDQARLSHLTTTSLNLLARMWMQENWTPKEQ